MNEALTAALRAACDPVLHLCYADVTDGHAKEGAKDGRAVRADGRDVQVLVVSSCFEGMGPLERQSQVNQVLSPHIISGGLHSVRMRCWTPSQWDSLGRCRRSRPIAFEAGWRPGPQGTVPGCRPRPPLWPAVRF